MLTWGDNWVIRRFLYFYYILRQLAKIEIVTMCVSLLHFALLHFALTVLHFVSICYILCLIFITFCVITFCVDYYILWRNTAGNCACKVPNISSIFPRIFPTL